MKKYTTITDVAEQYVAVELQEYADEFDNEEIAREITEYQDGGFVVEADFGEFWEVAKKYRLSN